MSCTSKKYTWPEITEVQNGVFQLVLELLFPKFAPTKKVKK